MARVKDSPLDIMDHCETKEELKKWSKLAREAFPKEHADLIAEYPGILNEVLLFHTPARLYDQHRASLKARVPYLRLVPKPPSHVPA
jgi:hypothetical protein